MSLLIAINSIRARFITVSSPLRASWIDIKKQSFFIQKFFSITAAGRDFATDSNLIKNS